jgi:hypothetical protein
MPEQINEPTWDPVWKQIFRPQDGQKAGMQAAASRRRIEPGVVLLNLYELS